jgi:drug/metabolite transporter (DMT)-like permease
VAVVLALTSAAVYGAADFLGGLASRKTSVFGVVALSQVVGLAALLALLPWLGGPVDGTDLAWGVAAGVAGASGLVLFFRTLARGVMSVIAPVTAVTSAAVPVLVGLLGGNRIGLWAAVGIALALAAVVLVSAEGGMSALRAARPASLAPALAAGTAFGFFFVLLDRTSEEAGVTPLVAARMASVALVVVLALATRQALQVTRPALPLVALSGVGDMTANALFLLAT